MQQSFENCIKFIRNLYNESVEFIPLHEPRFWGNEKKYLTECIDSTFVSSVGKFVDRFEQITAEYAGAKYAVVCVNGTAALHMALMLSGVKNGQEVITQPFTFIATANAISYCGADPVFIDIDKETLGLSPEKLNYFLQNNTRIDPVTSETINKISGKRIGAIVPMHTFGHPCQIDEIVKIADRYGIPVVEDAAESIGSKFKSKHTGTFGLLGILSFNGNKIITTGGGGMILTDNEDLARMAKHLTTQSKVPHPYEYVHDHIGYNYRLPNINAALGVAQMEQLDVFISNKRKIAESYQHFFDNSGITFISEPKDSFSNYWLNALLFADRAERDSFLELSNKSGVMTRPAWHLMNKLTMFKHCISGNLDNSEYIESRLVNIPSSPINLLKL